MLNSGVRSLLYACLIGNHPYLKPKTYSNIMAVKKYGNAFNNANPGGKIESSFSSLFQAMYIPIIVPIAKEMIKDMPTRNNVQANPVKITDETDCGKYAIETPRSPLKRWVI